MRVTVVSMTGLGLVELTRKRLRSSLRRTLTDECFYCEGLGTLKKKDTIVCEIFRDLAQMIAKKTATHPFIVHCHTDIVNWVYSEESETMDAALRRAGKQSELVRYQGLDHQLPDSAVRADMLSKADIFLRKSMGMPAD